MNKINLNLSTPVSIPEESKENVRLILENGNLFRYGEEKGIENHASLLEKEFADYLGLKYCTGMNSCGSTIFIALKTLGVNAGDSVLFNSFTLAPVPGAIYHACAIPIPVDIKTDYTIDFADLEKKAKDTNTKVLLLSHMRGHICNMPKLIQLCDKLNIKVIEDCAHTMESKWGNKYTGTFGEIGCFSTQSFKHINSGEGGLLVTNNSDISAKSILYSGSYALFEQHIARPEKDIFDKFYGKIPNFSLRMSNLVASIIRPQIKILNTNKNKWNDLYRFFEQEFNKIHNITVIKRDTKEDYIGSSIQFQITNCSYNQKKRLINIMNHNNIFIKWFGNKIPVGFTESIIHWKYVNQDINNQNLKKIIDDLFDMRIPVQLSHDESLYIVHTLKHTMSNL